MKLPIKMENPASFNLKIKGNIQPANEKTNNSQMQ